MTAMGYALSMGAHILLVEDDVDIRELLAELLVDEGYRVDSAADGHEALRVLREGLQPNLILLDLMMPLMGGMEFRAVQQADPGLAHIPVIVFTADAAIADKASSMGIAAAVKKPIDFESLLTSLETVLAGAPGPQAR